MDIGSNKTLNSKVSVVFSKDFLLCFFLTKSSFWPNRSPELNMTTFACRAVQNNLCHRNKCEANTLVSAVISIISPTGTDILC